MGFDSFKDEEEEESTQESQSSYVSFKNQRHPEVEVSEDKAHLHRQEYFDSLQEIRDAVGSDINQIFGEFAAGAVEANEGNPERLQNLFEDLTE